jgi:tripartite-type tricarboxylate transporter receptor subunit TctC
MAKPRLYRRLLAAVLLSLALAPVNGARAEYPERPIRLVVPFPPGGVTDVVARLMAERLSAEFGQQVVVDNKTGAGGVIAGDIVAKAAADGYTLLFTTPNHTINAAFRATLPYDTEKDLRAVSNVGQIPMLLVTHPSLPVTTFQGFIDYAAKNPGKINVSSAGNSTLPHITMELLMLREKFQVTNVPYRGAAPALADLVAGQVQAKLDNYTQSAQFIADRRLNVLAVTSARRLKQLPDVPTVAERLPGFEGYLWMGLVAPAATPDAVVQKLAAAARRFVALPARALERSVPFDRESRRERAFRGLRVQLHDGHRRRRRQVLRANGLQDVLRQARELRVQLQVDARREKREPLEQALDVRVGALEARQPETRGDLGILLRVLRPHLAHELQFPLVVAQQARVHQLDSRIPKSASVTWPVSRSSRVRM